MRGVQNFRLLLRHVAVFVSLILAVPAVHANGEERLRPGAPVVDTVRTQVTAAIAGILTSNCIAPDAPRPYDLTYLGLPLGDPHVSESLRSRINGALQEAIRGSGLAINVNAAENARALLPILGMGTESRQLEQMVNRLYASTFAVAVQVTRPSVDVSRLTIAIFARSEGGSYSCNRTVSINLHMPSFTVIGDFRSSSADLVELSGAYQAVLAAIAPKLSTATSLTFQPDVHVDGNCGLSQRAADTFTTAYFQMQEGELAAWLDGKPLPALITGQTADGKDAAGGGGIIMDVAFRLPEKDGRIVDLTITIRQGDTVLARRRALAVADEGMLDGCRPAAIVEASRTPAEAVSSDGAQVAAAELARGGAPSAPKTGNAASPVEPQDTPEAVAGETPAAGPAASAAAEPLPAPATATSPAEQEGQPQRHLFIIANHDYRYAEDVRYAMNDASAIEKLFVEQFGLAPTWAIAAAPMILLRRMTEAAGGSPAAWWWGALGVWVLTTAVVMEVFVRVEAVNALVRKKQSDDF